MKTLVQSEGLVTWDEFAALPEGDRRELIDGELVEIEMPTRIHEYIVAALAYFLHGWVRARRAGMVVASGYRLRVSDKRGVMPDLQFYRHDNPAGREERGVESGRPDLAVEVISPTGRRYDRVTKLGYYASLGVPEYWIVDPEARTLERLVLRDGGYLIAESLAGDDTFRPASFPELEIPLAELWTPPGEQPALPA